MTTQTLTSTITPEDSAKLHASLSKAKIRLMEKQDAAFFMEIAFSFKYEFTRSVPTAATDGVTVYLNPEFWTKHTIEQQVGLMLHETLHPAYEHLTRRLQRNPKLWNIAGDHRINLDLLERKFELPPGGYHDKKYGKLCTDDIYKDLEQQAQQNPQQFQQMQGMGEDLMDPPPGMTTQELADQIETMVVRAAIRSEQDGDKPGTIPGDLQIFIEKLKSPKMPWQQILARWLTEQARESLSWQRLNRRYLPHGIALPSLHSRAIMSMAIAIDVSGSIRQEQFDDFVSETAGILRMLKPPKIDFLQFDTSIKAENRITNLEELKAVKFTGRGGTLIQPVFKWASTHQPRLLLIFTDGEFRWPEQVPGRHTAVLWLKHGNKPFNPSVGTVIQYE